MAEEQPETQKRKKRRLKPATETIRQQQAKAGQQVGKTRRRPIRRFFRWLTSPLRWMARWKVWRSKPLKPVRWLLKIIGYILFVPYLKNSFKELKLVTWPNFRQSVRLTWAVLVFSLFFGVIITIVDFGLDKLFRKVILHL